MKKLVILLVSSGIFLVHVKSQNIFPSIGNAGAAGNAGIGITNPAFPLTISGPNGDKISLWGNTANGSSIGFGVQPGLLQIHSNQLSDDIVFGYGSSGNFREQMRIKGNGNVGIGINNPKTPLSFPPILGKKITLYPGLTGDVGFAVSGNRLQIYSDNPNADVAIGFDAAGTFNERFTVKPNGALAIKSNTGNPGEVLTSAGSGSSAEWKSPTNIIFQNSISEIQSTTLPIGGNAVLNIMDRFVTLNSRARFLINYQVMLQGNTCVICDDIVGFIDVFLDAVPISRSSIKAVGSQPISTTTGSILINSIIMSGNHEIKLRVANNSPRPITILGAQPGQANYGVTNMSVLIIPE